jgi:hypothetical protein
VSKVKIHALLYGDDQRTVSYTQTTAAEDRASSVWIIVLFQEVLDVSTVRNFEVMLGQKRNSLHRIL